MHFEERFFKYNKCRIRYYKIGSGNPILFLHGGGAKALTYKNILRLLSKKYSIIAPDLPGFGKSSTPIDAPEYILIMQKFIESLEYDEIAIMGYSLGGAIGLNLAKTIPDISLFILIDSAGIALECSKIEFSFEFIIKKSIQDLYLYHNLNLTLLSAADFFSNMPKAIFNMKKILRILRSFLFEGFSGFEDIKAKCLILWGEQDEIFPYKNAQEFHRQIRNSELIYVKGNHDWCLFEPDRCSEIIMDWLGINKY
jgi:abhydrolase domain-containing protein 6